jgi:CheY-like chemotaxis protein
LSDAGFVVHERKNSAEAIAILKENPYIAVLFTGIDMPRGPRRIAAREACAGSVALYADHRDVRTAICLASGSADRGPLLEKAI